ncbi:hypothetical protein UW163_23370 (plasmid) [Ralstonia solanacearum]|uniref:Uncharacterized protein n=1 Tax=Ralstonia solanacearum TaxID=305 RepID=A0A5H2PPL9_RALSL|nr:hypothetical protein UW163_23370 [Ralstonia solanacearum]AMP76935.1 hypothetical protein RALBFv3_22755 [Ralstonia solanacearum]AYB62273.1 hypothetical protein C2124_16910 [Ralstonia solanacearum]OAI69458.1 hypothetical protein RSP797_16890 [Ralstonia solanacearum]
MLFFLFLPFFRKIEIGSFIELEREVKETKREATAVREELRDFENEVRNIVSACADSTGRCFQTDFRTSAQLRQRIFAAIISITPLDKADSH